MFEYLIKGGMIHYRCHDFEHPKSDSKFNSMGILPKEWIPGENALHRRTTFTD